jgi:hypothetical protein
MEADIAFMRSIFKTEFYNKKILRIVLLLILLSIWLLPPTHAISWYANVGSREIEMQTNKHLNYGIEAFASGKTRLLYRQNAADTDMVTTINEGDQSFYGNYTLKASISMGATNKKKETDFQLESCGFSQVV